MKPTPEKALIFSAFMITWLAIFWTIDRQNKFKEEFVQVILDNPETIIKSVQRYDQKKQEESQQSQQKLIDQLQNDPKSLIGESPTYGNPNAKYILMEFSDFQCPFCGKSNPAVKAFMDKHKDEVLLVYKHFPLEFHAQALPSAKASYAAQKQGKFWDFHDRLFENQDKLSDEYYLEVAKSLNLNIEQFKKDQETALSLIQKDIELAKELGIQGTPFFILNGQPHSGMVENPEILENLLTKVKQ